MKTTFKGEGGGGVIKEIRYFDGHIKKVKKVSKFRGKERNYQMQNNFLTLM